MEMRLVGYNAQRELRVSRYRDIVELTNGTSNDAHVQNPVPMAGPESQREEIMELLTLAAFVGSLILLAVLALRYGADSRIWDKSRPNW